MTTMIKSERIRELARQAGINLYPLSYSLDKEEYFRGDHINLLYRFVDLIAKECELKKID